MCAGCCTGALLQGSPGLCCSSQAGLGLCQGSLQVSSLGSSQGSSAGLCLQPGIGSPEVTDLCCQGPGLGCLPSQQAAQAGQAPGRDASCSLAVSCCAACACPALPALLPPLLPLLLLHLLHALPPMPLLLQLPDVPLQALLGKAQLLVAGRGCLQGSAHSIQLQHALLQVRPHLVQQLHLCILLLQQLLGQAQLQAQALHLASCGAGLKLALQAQHLLIQAGAAALLLSKLQPQGRHLWGGLWIHPKHTRYFF